MSSDDSAIFLDSESALVIPVQYESDLDEIYKYVPPPIPLIPKNKYKESSRFLRVNNNKDTKFLNNRAETSQKSHKNSHDSLDSSSLIALSNIFETSSIIYQRDPSKSGNP